MAKQKKETVQINRRVSKDAKQLLEDLEKNGLTLEFIIKDYVRLRKMEKIVWRRIDKKLNILVHATKGERVVVIEKTKSKKKKSWLQKLKEKIIK